MSRATDPAPLLARRNEFKAFLAARLGNGPDAEDLLQNSLTKALARAGELREEEKLVPWFYQLLRNAIVDHVRSRQAAHQREEAWAHTAILTAEEAHDHACRCFNALLPTLKPAQAALLRRVELEGEPVAAAADALGLSPGNASVILHRARKELRNRLEAFCGTCAEEACLDCDCDEAAKA